MITGLVTLLSTETDNPPLPTLINHQYGPPTSLFPSYSPNQTPPPWSPYYQTPSSLPSMESSPEFGPGPGPSSFSNNEASPWVWVLIPVGIVVAIGALAVCLHSKRRLRLASYLHSTAPDPPPQPRRSRAINERELEEAWVRGAPPTTAIPSPGGRWQIGTSSASRWYWAGDARRGGGRTEEGLNELGEAPPPYEKAKKSEVPTLPDLNLNGEGPAPKSVPGSPAFGGAGGGGRASRVEEVELQDLERSRSLGTEQSTSMGTASEVSVAGRSVTGGPLSPAYTMSMGSVPSTPASSVHGQEGEGGLSPPPYEGFEVGVFGSEAELGQVDDGEGEASVTEEEAPALAGQEASSAGQESVPQARDFAQAEESALAQDSTSAPQEATRPLPTQDPPAPTQAPAPAPAPPAPFFEDVEDSNDEIPRRNSVVHLFLHDLDLVLPEPAVLAAERPGQQQ